MQSIHVKLNLSGSHEPSQCLLIISPDCSLFLPFLHSTISFVTWSKKYEWAVTGLGTIRRGLALFQRISGPLAELQIIKSTIERNLWGYFRDTKQTWAHGVFPMAWHSINSKTSSSVHTPTTDLPPFPSRPIFYGRVKNDEFKTVLLIGYFFTHIILFEGPDCKTRGGVDRNFCSKTSIK